MLEAALLGLAWLASSAAMGLLITCWTVAKVLDVSFSTALSVALSVVLNTGERAGRFARETARRVF